MSSPGLRRVLCLVLIAVCSLAGAAVYAGENGVAKVRVPACVRGECRSGVRMPAAILQTAALAAAQVPGSSQAIKQKVRQLPRSRRANKLPSWYKRAQAAAMQSQSLPAQQLRRGAVSPSGRARVRESVVTPASERSQGRDLARQASSAASVTTRPEPVLGRGLAVSRPEARGTRHRRLVQESLDTMDEGMDQEAESREPGSASAQLMDGSSERLLGNENFTSAIKADPFGHYELAEPVVLNSTKDLPLSNATHPFRGELTGRGANSLQLNLTRQEDGDLHLFGGLANAFMDLSVKDSSLVSKNGSVALFGGATQNSTLSLRVDNSELKAAGGSHCALVEKLKANNTIDLTMSNSNIRLSASRAGEGPVVAGPVARTVGRNNAMRVQDASANRVEAEGQSSPVVASLGWGHLDFENCTVGVSSGCPLKSTADDRLDQSNLTQNHIVARAAGMEARAHASLAGSYGQKDWQGVHRLEQWGMTGNTIKAQVNGSAAGLGLASLGLVHDLKDVEYSTGGGEGASRDNRKALFYIRQQKCSNNTVMGAAQERIQEGGPVASLSLTADHSRNQSLARNLFRVMHNQVSENGLVVDRNSGAGFNDTDAVLVGSFEHEAPTPECPASPFANRTCDTPGNGSLVPLDETTPVVLFLFSGGGRLLPILPKNDSALVWMSDAVCDSPSMIDEAAYAFGGDMADANYDCLRNPDAADCPSFARPCGYKYQTSCCNNTGTSGAVSCSEWNSDCPGAAADGVQIVVNSIAPDAWKEVNRAFCKRVPWIFDGKADLCAGIAGMRSCHNPGEELHDLVPTGTSWLLVTRQTWPAGSKGNDSNADLFRILSFSLSQSAQDSEPLWNSDAFTGKSNEAGQLYADTRVVPAGNGPIFALVDGKSLVYVYQIVATDQEPRLRFIDLSGNSTAMPVAWKLPTGAELMLVSREADGVSVWIKKRADAVVERFLLEDIQKNGTTAPVSSFGLTSGSDVEREPLALARPKDSLYSLHATGVEDATGREFEIRRWRWNISSPTATLDRDLKRCTRGMSPGRLVVTSLGVQRVPELSFPVGEGSFKPGVPAEGGCLKWEWQALGHDVPCAVRPTVTLTSEVPVEAIASVVLVVTGGCIGLTAGVCVQKAYQYKKRKNSRPVDSVTRQRLPLLPLQEVLEASPYENVYDAIDDIHVYEDVSRADAVTRSEAENAGEVLPEYELPSGRESGGTEACTQINAEDAGEVLPEHQLPSGTESGGAKGYAQLNADDAGAVPPGYQMLSGTELGGAGGYAQLNAADADVMLPEHPLPSGTESGGAAGYAQLNAADAWAEQPEQQPSVGTDPGGAGGYVNIGGMAAGTEHTGDPPQPLSEPQPGGGAESAHGSILSEPEPGGTGGQVSLGGMTAGTEPAGDPPQPVSEPEPGGAGGYVNISGMTAGTQQRGDAPQSLSEPQPGGASADAHPGDVDVCAQQSQQQSSAGIESSALGLREEPGVADASERGNGRRGVASSLPPSTSTTTPPPRSFSVPLLLPEVTDPDGDGTDFPAEKLSAF